MKKPSGKLSSVTASKRALEALMNQDGVPWDKVRDNFDRYLRLLAELEQEWANIQPTNGSEAEELRLWAEEHIEDKVKFKHELEAKLVDMTVQPQDSASSVSKHSGATNASSIKSERALAIMRRKELEMKQSHIRKLRDLEQEKIEAERVLKTLSQKHEDLQIELDIEREKMIEDTLRQVEELNVPSQTHPLALTNTLNARPIESPALGSGFEEVVPEVNRNAPIKTDALLERFLNIQVNSTLPKRDFRLFKGKVTEYHAFLAAFHYHVEKKTDDDEDRLQYLLQYTQDEPHELISPCVHLGPMEGYKEARRLLEREYGNQHRIAAAYRKEVAAYPSFKEDPKMIRGYATLLSKCTIAMKGLNNLASFNDSEQILKLTLKLPTHCQGKWRQKVRQIEETGQREVNFEDFSDFVRLLSDEWNHPVYGIKNEYDADNLPSTLVKDRHNIVLATSASPKGSSQADSNLCPFCDSSHNVDACSAAMALPLDVRRETLKGRCFGCLGWGHWARTCRVRKTCNTCHKRHPTILHEDRSTDWKSGTSRLIGTGDGDVNANVRGIQVLGQDKRTKPSKIAVALVPVRVRVRGQTKDIVTYAAQDPYSTDTFITEDLLASLGVQSEKTEVLLTTMTQRSTMVKAQRVEGLEVLDLDEQNAIALPTVLAYKDLPVDREDLPTKSQIDAWPHLAQIPLQWSTAHVGILIGMNVPGALRPLEVVHGKDNEPYAVRTKLGWSVHGPVGTGLQNNAICNRIKVDTSELGSLLEQMYNHDCPDKVGGSLAGPSVEDREWLLKVQESLQMQEDNHYSIGLPFRDAKPDLQCNIAQVLRRAQGMKKKFLNNPMFFNKYKIEMEKLLSKRYAEPIKPLGPVEIKEGVFYIPHHGVFHPKKPGKLRVVFDCSAMFNGKSLNSELLQGPDLTNGLLGVLLRFRQEKIALVADIEAMFYQVVVPPRDRDYLRFLWWPNGDLDKPIQEFRLTVHLFGAVSSPSCANYALQRTVIDHGANYSEEARGTIRRNFYVDDLLKSVPSVADAQKLLKELVDLCAEGGFKLTKFMSNSAAVVPSTPAILRANSVFEVRFEVGNILERTLGVLWDVMGDNFKFEYVNEQDMTTRRKLLSTISSMYDPLGMVAPAILPARLEFRNLCLKSDWGWDAPIPKEQMIVLERWVAEIAELSKLEIPRCFKSTMLGTIVSCQLHHFSDASECGYATVSYIRLEDKEGHVTVSFVGGKARVAPKKLVSIPRMELIAAVLSVKQNEWITSEIEYQIGDVFYWTDSMTVLKYIANRTRRFHTFVANRIQVIHEGSSPDQWRFVPTNQNPADDGSRGISFSFLVNGSAWLTGPKFLFKPRELWPAVIAVPDVDFNDEALRMETKVMTTVSFKPCLVESLAGNCHSFEKLRRVMHTILCAISLMKKQNRIEFCPEKTDHVIFAMIQREYFAKELEEIERRDRVGMESRLSSANPTIINGLLRVGGRLRNAEVRDDFKYPIILPKDSRVSELIVRLSHKTCGHLGREYMLSELSQRFWIIGANQMVRKEINHCITCRKVKAQAMTQMMSDLPPDRVREALPFENSGVDYFGPFYVKRGRTQEKRYGVMFTCLATRATHLEVAYSMDSDSFLNALRRLIARRGRVKTLRSDNGTNFHGGNKELTKQIKALFNGVSIEEATHRHGIQWKFNAPGASHHGGAWERAIRTARQILQTMLKEEPHALTDESLLTLFCEIEAIMNKRPLTTPSSDPSDLEALTPNHLLHLRGGELHPFGEFPQFVRSRWKRIQHLADQFWHRWKKGYLSDLRSRQKWKQNQPNLKQGDLVLVIENTMPRNQWLLGLVEKPLPGKDKLVRVVQVKTKNGIITRPITKLCLLSANEVGQ